MSNKYINLVGINKIKDEYTKINTGAGLIDADVVQINTDLTTHKNNTSNPHNTTAAQVGAYSKTELQTSGQASVHWGNLTNVPNLADKSWKAAVANKAALPLANNEIGDQRVVLDDGDGKSAVYICKATTGDVNAQWSKIGDVDWASEESTRVAQEAARVTAEGGRVTTESIRVTAESGRVSAENNRVTAETTRGSNETTRINNEAARITAESNRVTAENNRVSAESTRGTNESNRISAESTRLSNETLRGTAESGRASAESARVTAENGRVSAESARVTAEGNRAAAESTRASNEVLRMQFSFTGEYNAGTAYKVNNIVSYNGSTYICILNSTGNLPTNTTYFSLVAQKGTDGTTGTTVTKGTTVIPTTGWVANTGDNALKCNITIAGVAVGDWVDVTIDKDYQDTANAIGLNGTLEEYAGGITVFANSVPSLAIPIRYMVVK